MSWNTDMSTAPKDRPILGWCHHDSDTFYEGDTHKLTVYSAHAEGLSHVDDGPCVLVWGGELVDEDYSIPNWWFQKGSEFEVAANPVAWMPIEDFVPHGKEKTAHPGDHG